MPKTLGLSSPFGGGLLTRLPSLACAMWASWPLGGPAAL